MADVKGPVLPTPQTATAVAVPSSGDIKPINPTVSKGKCPMCGRDQVNS